MSKQKQKQNPLEKLGVTPGLLVAASLAGFTWYYIVSSTSGAFIKLAQLPADLVFGTAEQQKLKRDLIIESVDETTPAGTARRLNQGLARHDIQKYTDAFNWINPSKGTDWAVVIGTWRSYLGDTDFLVQVATAYHIMFDRGLIADIEETWISSANHFKYKTFQDAVQFAEL